LRGVARTSLWLRGADINEYPNVKRWFGEIGARPAVPQDPISALLKQ
jgi:glutathione S-transferase